VAAEQSSLPSQEIGCEAYMLRRLCREQVNEIKEAVSLVQKIERSR